MAAKLKPATPEQRARVVALLSPLPAKAGDEIDAKLTLAAYDIALDDIPADLLEVATRQAIKECRFRPSPAELRAFVKQELYWRRESLRTAELEVRTAEEDARRSCRAAIEKAATASQEEIAELNRLMKKAGETLRFDDRGQSYRVGPPPAPKQDRGPPTPFNVPVSDTSDELKSKVKAWAEQAAR